MKFGEGWSLGQALGEIRIPKSEILRFRISYFVFRKRRLTFGLFVSLLVGCASGPPQFDQALMAEMGSTSRNQGVVQAYHVFCPDVLEIRVTGHPELCGRRAIDPDGRIDLGKLGRLRIEGRSLPQLVNLLSDEIGVSADQIQVQVAEFNSQQIYLFGQVMPPGGGVKGATDGPGFPTSRMAWLASWGLPQSSQRAVPYQGPETVLDMLQRVGGITPGAAPNDVHVVRSRLADNLPPEVFHIDLQAIVMSQDQSTNLRLQPFDQVFVGEAKRSSLEKCLPPCLRPTYEKLCGIWRPGSFSYSDPLPVQTLKANIAARNMAQPATFRGAADPE